MPPQNPQPTNNKKKRILIIVAIIVAIIAIALVTVVLLSISKPNFTSKSTNTSTQKSLSAKQLLSDYRNDATIKGLVQKNYSTINGSGMVSYKITSEKYGIIIATDQSTAFSAINGYQANDTAKFQSATKAYAQKQGIIETSNDMLKSSDTTSYKTFVSDATVCESTDNYPSEKSKLPQNHAFACIDIAKIKDGYSNINDLLRIHPIGEATAITPSTQDNGHVAYTTLTATVNDKKLRFLYAAVDKKWSYIGEYSASSNGRFTMTDDMIKTASDSKYNNFIPLS